MIISSTKNVTSNGIKCLVYGDSGAGKTTLAKTLEDKTLIISAESGLLSLAGTEIDVLDLNQFDSNEKKLNAIGEIFTKLRTKEYQEKYQVIFIDSITEISQIMVAFLKTKFPDRKDGLVLWGEYSDKVRNMIKAFRDLAGYDVVFTALRAVERDENNRRYAGIDMNGKISKQIEALLDEIFCLEVITDDEGNKRRVFITNRNDQYAAKDRSGKLEQYEPAHLGHVFTKIKGE